MSQVKFMKWYPFTRQIPEIKLDEVITFEHDEEWLRAVNLLITMGFYVGIHWSPDNNLITIVIDTTWFKQR